jgi:putative Ca2+/H+ antiporter (TMEM165/GDT1 family)
VEALVTSFLAAALAEWGDKTQLFVIALAVRYRQPVPVLAGFGLGGLASMLLAALAGTFIHDVITLRAISLLLAVALIFAAASGFAGKDTPEIGGSWPTGPLATAAGGTFLLEFGDKSQFLTSAIAAQFDSVVLATAGATAGMMAAAAPAALLGDRLAVVMPMKPLRIGIAVLFLLIGFLIAVSALRLI